MTSTELQEKMYKEILAIREQLSRLERIIVPEEELTGEELEELARREAEAERGEVVSLEEAKARLEERRR